jgi:hypothetical protein
MDFFKINKEVKKNCDKAKYPNYTLHNFDILFKGFVVAPSGCVKNIN